MYATRRFTTLGAAAAACVLLVTGLVPSSASEDPPEPIAGRLVDLDRVPVAGIAVDFRRDGKDHRVHTDPNGVFTFLADHGSAVTVTDPQHRFVPCVRDEQTNAVPGEPEELDPYDRPSGQAGDVHLCRPATVTGRILDSSGDAIEGAQVTYGRNASDLTDASGRFVFSGVMPRRYQSFAVGAFPDRTSTAILARDRLVKDGQAIDLGTRRLKRPDDRLGSVTMSNDWFRANRFWSTTLPASEISAGRPTQLPGQSLRAGLFRLQLDRYYWYRGHSQRSAQSVRVVAGRTTQLRGPDLDRQQIGFGLVDDRGEPQDRLFVVVRRVEDPVEVIATTLNRGNNWVDFSGLRRDRYRFTVTDPLGRFAPRTAHPQEVLDLGHPRRHVPRWDDSDDRRRGEFLWHLSTGKESTGRHVEGVVTLYDSETGRSVQAEDASSAQASNVPQGGYRLRFSDPTGRLKSAWIGGGTSFRTAPTFWTRLGIPTDLPPLRLTPGFSPILLPKVTGTARPGKVLSASRGTWDGGPSRFTYRWLRNGKPIPGATTTRYRVTTRDVGRTVSVRVKARKGAAAKTMRSLSVRPRRSS